MYSLGKTFSTISDTYVVSGLCTTDDFKSLDSTAHITIIPSRSLRTRLLMSQEPLHPLRDIACLAHSIKEARRYCTDPMKITSQTWKFPVKSFSLVETAVMLIFISIITGMHLRPRHYPYNGSV